jgi:oligoendopeptidase F
MLERVHALTEELGWSSYRQACAELRGIDLEALAAEAEEFVRETDGVYAEIADPELKRAGVAALGELRRSDLPRFFRAPALDALFPAERAVEAFAETVAGLGIDLDAQDNVHLDTESRPTKSSRAFCATPGVPGEIYLVISPTGGRDDYEALFHEGGHVEHYAHVDSALPIEHRRLGDNSVTESFAFLLEHLTEDPEWLGAALGVEDPGAVVRQARAVKLVMLRRYAAKIAYELDLHGAEPDPERMPARYAELLGSTTRVAWPRDSWLADVDPAFYVACYLRAWALETSWRSALRERFGARWFESDEAGEWLRSLWRQGQRLDAHELLAEALGEELDFRVLTREFASAG